ncbi:MAG: branched-chain amino acid ABC transporter permease [Candidatus Tectomicrobia bacterium]|uniref:Branched-chain amino acid ABC transporter permease n=1 Tax=Tectimicrobiota bacterium TaxID=2528274 RepID=A0A932MPA4_UNCTE|nr:branched-chain amino acid ABC transporter permease [Candidatus Tectomicrobia bacterium]
MRALRWTFCLAAAILLLCIPLTGERFYMYLTIQVLILALFAMGFNLLFGYTGLLSFGHAGFYAAGAYATGLLLMRTPLSLLPSILGGALVAGGLGVVIGFFCVRHTRIYFAMLTLAFGMMVYALAFDWKSVTGGDDGLIGIPRGSLWIPGMGAVKMNALWTYYYLVLAITAAGVGMIHRVVHSPFGLVLQGIRENENRAAFAGVPVRRYRLAAFALSSFISGLAGAMVAPLENTVAPTAAHWTKSAAPVLATLLGGIHTFAGPMVGAFLFYVIQEFIERMTEFWLLGFGLVLLVLVLGFRGGVVGYYEAHIRPALCRRLG